VILLTLTSIFVVFFKCHSVYVLGERGQSLVLMWGCWNWLPVMVGWW